MSSILATWFNLDAGPESLGPDYLDRMVNDHEAEWSALYQRAGDGPAMRALGLAAARPEIDLPRGSDYLLLSGFSSSEKLFQPSFLEWKSVQSAAFSAQGSEVRHEIYVEDFRVDGPSGPVPEEIPGEAIQFGAYTMQTLEADVELYHWYVQQRLRIMEETPGSLRTRKLVGATGWPRHAVLYEFDSLETRLTQHEERNESQTTMGETWTGQIAASAIYPWGSPFVGQRLCVSADSSF